MRELYRMMDTGNIEGLNDIVRTLEGDEWVEGQFWNIYWLVQQTRDLNIVKERTKALLEIESESTVTRIFIDLLVAFTQYQKGDYTDVLHTLEKIQRKNMSLGKSNNLKKKSVNAFTLFLQAKCYYLTGSLAKPLKMLSG